MVAKSEDAKQAIREKLNMAFMFSALDENEKRIVVDAMEECKIGANDVVIQEGDQGDCLYVIGSGTLKCTKVLERGAAPTMLKTY